MLNWSIKTIGIQPFSRPLYRGDPTIVILNFKFCLRLIFT